MFQGSFIFPNRKVYIAPIPKDTTQEEIKSLVSGFGEVSSSSIRSRKDGRGFAFITFETEEAASKAVTANGNLKFKDEQVSIEFRKSGKKTKKKIVSQRLRKRK